LTPSLAGAAPPQKAARFLGWRMVALAFVAYNCGVTVVVTAFGPALPVLQRELGASRASVSMAFALLMLFLGLLAPVVGTLTRWVKLRTLMMAGAALHATGFLLLAFAHTLFEVLLVFGLILGSGACLMGVVAAPTLVSRWFEKDRGKALGLALMQVLGLVAAPLAGRLIQAGGSHLLFLCLAGFFAALVPVMSLVIDAPEIVGQTPRQGAIPSLPAAIAPPLSTVQIFSNRRFWLLSLAVGICTGAGVAFASHGPAMAIAHGASLTMGSVVLAASGGGALLGSMVFGWLADRVGPFGALAAALGLAAAAWLTFSAVTVLPWMVLLGGAMGGFMGAAIVLHSACMAEIFGRADFSRAIGFSYFLKIPFLFGFPPLAGRLYDLSGGYGSTYVVVVGSLAFATLIAAALTFEQRRRPTRPIAADSVATI
jgi:MFS family permease